MAKVDLAEKLSDVRARVSAERLGDVQPGLPKFARLTRKEARVREDQYAALSTLARTLMRRRKVKDERITENTLIRVAIDLLLAHQDTLRGATEDELRESVTPGLRDFGNPRPPESRTHELPNSRSPGPSSFGTHELRHFRTVDRRSGGTDVNRLSTPVPGETLADAGERIRAACPILGATATNEACHTRRELITDTLDARGVRPVMHSWHPAQLLDGHVVGVFADSREEAEIDLTVWWGRRCHWVIPDPQCHVLHEYVPASNRGATAAATRFPLGPPRRPRDQFAPAPSLLDGIFPERGSGQ